MLAEDLIELPYCVTPVSGEDDPSVVSDRFTAVGGVFMRLELMVDVYVLSGGLGVCVVDVVGLFDLFKERTGAERTGSTSLSDSSDEIVHTSIEREVLCSTSVLLSDLAFALEESFGEGADRVDMGWEEEGGTETVTPGSSVGTIRTRPSACALSNAFRAATGFRKDK